jgi:cysteinyl-tRNA synthetase
MGLKLFNTLSRSIQEFAPLNPPNVGMYCCGPTVYDFAHIGNWRTFVFADLVRRYLEFKGCAVTHVMNITDVEDKIIKGIREAKTTLREFTDRYESAFFADMKTLNCLEPHHKPRATDFIPAMIELIEKLVARGIAYQATDGSVYFSIEKYRGSGCAYGQLLKLNFDEMRVGERVASDDYAKESAGDFVLWKARVPEDGDVFWPSPWREGRPGWHIECSAMSMKFLGQSFDLHLGGEDLIFPHHEDEIAQSEGATGKPFVKHWLHGAHLLVEGKKMSKSLGNFFTLRDLLVKDFTGPEIRFALLQAHYRESFNCTLHGLQGARTALARIKECLEKVLETPENAFQSTTVPPFLNTSNEDTTVLNAFSAALDDDLNVSKAWGVIFAWIRELNRKISQNNFSVAEASVAWFTWRKLDQVLGLNLNIKTCPRIVEDKTHVATLYGGQVFTRLGEGDVPSKVRNLDTQRLAAKALKNFALADKFRDEIKSEGFLVEDTPKGTKFKPVKKQ